jgi:two-component sensor histidine kinase
MPAGRARLVFQDDGRGFPQGMDWQSAPSLGLRLIRMLSDQLGAELEWKNGTGTTFELRFPLADAEAGGPQEAKAVADGAGKYTHR